MVITAFVLVLARAAPAALLPFLLTLLLLLWSTLLGEVRIGLFLLYGREFIGFAFWLGLLSSCFPCQLYGPRDAGIIDGCDVLGLGEGLNDHIVHRREFRYQEGTLNEGREVDIVLIQLVEMSPQLGHSRRRVRICWNLHIKCTLKLCIDAEKTRLAISGLHVELGPLGARV